MFTDVETVAEESQVEVQRQVKKAYGAPEDAVIIKTVAAVLSEAWATDAGLTIRIVDSEEIRVSNNQWRGKNKATNVLSFPAEIPPETGINYLGDMLICAEVLQRESVDQKKALNDHWAHIVTHGVLHLCGYDHENDADAQIMEKREIEILATLGVADPYQDGYEYSGDV